jgi:hypothetical protein
MSRKKSPIAEELLQLRDRLAEWRRSHPPRSRLPEEIWAAAVELARRHGVYRTARALSLDYVHLRKRLGRKRAVQPTAVARPEFLEVFMPPTQSSGWIEVLRIPSSGAVDWSQLFRAWRQNER